MYMYTDKQMQKKKFDSLYTQSKEHNECFRYNRYVSSIITYIMKDFFFFLQSGRHFMESFL